MSETAIPITSATPANASPTPQPAKADAPTALSAPKDDAGPDTSSASSEAAAAKAEEIRKHRVTVDGEEIEVDEPELLKGYSRTRAANKRFEDAAKARKELDQTRAQIEAREREFTETIQLVRSPKHRVEAIARLLGGQEALHDLAVDVLAQRMEWESLPLEERKRREQMTEREKRIAEEERQIEAREKALKERRRAELDAQSKSLVAQYQKTFPEALKKAGAPSTPYAVQRLARTMGDALDAGAPLSLDEAAQIVAEDIRDELRSVASSADPNTLREMLGENAEKLRQAELERVRAQPGRAAPQTTPPPEREPAAIMTTDDVRRMFRRR
jgi:hypothetical protein